MNTPVKYQPENQEFFCITNVSRADLEELGCERPQERL